MEDTCLSVIGGLCCGCGYCCRAGGTFHIKRVQKLATIDIYGRSHARKYGYDSESLVFFKCPNSTNMCPRMYTVATLVLLNNWDLKHEILSREITRIECQWESFWAPQIHPRISWKQQRLLHEHVCKASQCPNMFSYNPNDFTYSISCLTFTKFSTQMTVNNCSFEL